MSTKIDSTPALPPGRPAAMDKLASAKLAQAAYGSAAAPAGSGRGDDTVQITGDAMHMQSLEKSLSRGGGSFDVERVAAVRQAIADGRYQVNPERIASRLIASDKSLG